MKATKNHDHFHSQAKEKTDVKSLQRENLTAGQQKLFYFRTLLHQKYQQTCTTSSLLANFAKMLTREDCCLAIFSHKLRIQVSQTTRVEQV